MKPGHAVPCRRRMAGRAAGRGLAGAAALLGLAGMLGAAGARVNTSRSVAPGLYWTSGQAAARGAYVLLCPPDTGAIVEARRRGYLAGGPCPGGHGYLIKRVLAAGGDVVAVDGEGVVVNGIRLPLSAPLDADRAGRALPRLRMAPRRLGAAEILPMSDVSRTSFDGRYFGPVDRSLVRSVIVPVFTW